ncbi:hypothetical protein D3C78_1391570 [compost metagenome]
MMEALINVLFCFAWQAFLFADARSGKRMPMNTVDFVKGQPVAYQLFIALEADLTEAYKRIHHVAVHPAVVFFAQRQRHLIVGERDQRLNVVTTQLAEHIFIILQTRLVRRGIFAGRENARPGN